MTKQATIICIWCGKSFEVVTSIAKNRKYCDRKCMSKSFSKKSTKTCLVCNKSFTVVPSTYNKRKCCSRMCARNPKRLVTAAYKITRDELNMFTNEASQLKKSERLVFNNLIGSSLRNLLIYPRQQIIGNEIDRVRGTVNRAIKSLVVKGLLRKRNRGWHTCLYYINPAVVHPSVRNRMLRLFPSLEDLDKLLEECKQ